MFIKTKFIAEVCSNHNQDLKRIKKFIKKSKEIGCYAIKFQLFKIEKLFSQEVLLKSNEHRMRKKYELPEEFLSEIYIECKKNKIKFGCTPFDLDAVDKLKDYVDFFKISSYEILWKDLFKKCAKTGKPIIFSTGMAKNSEVINAKKIIKSYSNKTFTVLNCISEYPAKFDKLNLNYFNFLKKKISRSIGWSDHTKDPLLLSFLIDRFNLDYIEFHLDLDKKGYEYNYGHCWLPDEIKKVIEFTKITNKLKYDKFDYSKYLSFSENKERKWRADPKDGLRPLKAIRNKKDFLTKYSR